MYTVLLVHHTFILLSDITAASLHICTTRPCPVHWQRLFPSARKRKFTLLPVIQHVESHSMARTILFPHSPSPLPIFTLWLQDGRTALTCSAENGHVDITQLLLESKADVHAAENVPPSPPPPTSHLRVYTHSRAGLCSANIDIRALILHPCRDSAPDSRNIITLSLMVFVYIATASQAVVLMLVFI